VIPGFDPEVDWHRDGKVEGGNRNRLLGSNGKAMWFHSPIVRDCDRPMGAKITLRGQAGMVQTIGINESGDNYSQQWTCTFELYNSSFGESVGGKGGGSNANAQGFPHTVGPVAHICLTDIENFEGLEYPVTLLFKTEHGALHGMPGFHGLYAQEPFSCTTGNGGTLFHLNGQTTAFDVNTDGQVVAPLPYGGTWRAAAVTVRHTGGALG
jgi:hypothetical protein